MTGQRDGKRLRRGLAAGLGAAALTFVGAVSVWPARAGTLSIPTTTALSGDVLRGLSALTGTPVASSTPMQVGVIMSDPNASGLASAYRAIYTPGGPSFHHFLTASETAARFGVPAAGAAAVRSWTTRDGLGVAYQPADNEYLLLEGTAAQVERTFSVGIKSYVDGTTTFYANSVGPTVPSGVQGVIGLNDLLKSRTFHHAPAVTSAHGLPMGAPSDAVSQGTCVGPECLGLTTPQDLWSAYEQPTQLSDPSADFGQGQQLAVLGEGEVKNVIGDLRVFEHEFALPQVPITVRPVGDDFSDSSGDGEWDIDMQATTGMAPKAFGESLYFAKDLTDSSVLGDITAWTNDSAAPLQANASFGECEEDPTSPVLEPGANNGTSPTSAVLAGPAGQEFTQQAEQELTQANLQGKTLFASTGDTGSSCPVVTANVNGVGNEAFPETNYPASSPHVVAVGGTVLYTSANTAAAPASNSQRAQETAWTFGGGGNTFYVAQPDYQKGITLLDAQDCVVQPDGAPYASPTPCRGIPDVAAQSGDIVSNGYAVTMAGQTDQQGAGTSLSSPLWVGMWARVQAAAPTSSGLGFADPTLYSIGKSTAQDAAAFFDIGQGPPSSPSTTNGYYASLPRSALDASGWDYVSGLGSPNLVALARDATGSTTLAPSDNVTAPAAQDCGQPGLAACPTSTGPGSGTAQTCSGGVALWTNPAHTAKDALGNPDAQLSLLSEHMAVSSDASKVGVTLQVSDMSHGEPPTGSTGEAWYATWTYKGTEYFADAEVGLGGSADFGDGTYTASTGYQQANSDTGTFTDGPGGTVTINVPLQDIGGGSSALPLGSVLQQPGAVSFIEEGVPANPATGSTGVLSKVDSGGPGCSWAVVSPPSPANSTVTASPAVVPADGHSASTITVVVKDAHGDAVPGAGITLEPSGGSSVITPASGVVTDANGTGTFSVRDTTAQSVTYAVTDSADQVTVGSVTVTFTAPVPAGSTSATSGGGTKTKPGRGGKHR